MRNKSSLAISVISFLLFCAYFSIYNVSSTDRISHRILEFNRTVEESRRKFLLLNWGPGDWYQKNIIGNRIGNCEITLNHSRAAEADAIMFFIRAISSVQEMPLKTRKPLQYWVFMNTESPNHAIFEYSNQLKLSDFSGLYAFNWTMTYRTDSDAPIPYGRKLQLKSDDRVTDDQLRQIFRKKSKFVTGAASNCVLVSNHRGLWFQELSRLDERVEVFGMCGNAGQCPRHGRDLGCEKTRDYKFFLSFENSNCREYITEKFWFNALNYSAIPVILGARKSDLEKVAPENSFIHADDFDSPQSLLRYLNEVSEDEDKFLEYLQWRHKYSIESESFFLDDTYRWKALCDTLNQRYGESKTYPDISKWMSAETDCYLHEWTKKQLPHRDGF